MSNISLIGDSCSSIPLLDDYVIESVIMKNGSDDRNGEAIMMLSRGNERYEMNIELKEGKKEGVCKIMREDGTLFMKVMFVNDVCEGELIKKNEYGKTVLKGRLERGIEVGLWIEYDDRGKEIWRGLYRNGKRYSTLKKTEGMDGFNSEVSDKGELLNVGEYDKDWIRNGRSFECEGGHVKRECIYEDGVRTKVIREFTDKGLMRVFDDEGRIVYEGVWFGDIVNGFSAYPRMEGMDGFFKEMNEKGELLSVSEYDEDVILKEGKCFEFEGERVVRECEYKNGECVRVIREWKGDVMIEYDDNGKRVYEGGWKGDMKRGYVREGKGREYEGDGKRALYYGDWKNGLREGYGSEFKGGIAVYIGEWKNGMRDGEGEEYNDNEEVVRRGIWIEGGYVKRFENGYGNDCSVFDISCIKGVTRLVIGDDCFKKVNEFVIDGLNELESVKIGKNSFSLSEDTRKGSKCLIMNCDGLREVEIGDWSFEYYEVFELKNLPSLHSIQMGYQAFWKCHSIVFESDNDE